MTDADRLLQCLESIASGRCCDDCLARAAGLPSPREAGRLCRELAARGVLRRKRGKCPLGEHTRTINMLEARPAKGARRDPAPAAPGIEEAWRYVDRFCRALWIEHVGDDPPQSLADAITRLRDEQVLPVHEANMMHTIRSLRNLVVHENLAFGEHETTIARAAWSIIRAWAEQRQRDAWQRTMALCAARAA